VSLLDRHGEFLQALRRAGLPVSVAEDIDAGRALAVVDLLSRSELRAAYAAALVKRRADRAAFDTLFEIYFPALPSEADPDVETETPPSSQRASPPSPAGPGPMTPEVREFREQLLDALRRGDEAALSRLARAGVARFGGVAGAGAGTGSVQSWSRYSVLTRVSPRTLLASFLAATLPAGERDSLAERGMRATFGARVSRFEQLVETEVHRRLAVERGEERVARSAVRPSTERVDLLRASDVELAEIRRAIQPLARRLATRLAQSQRHGRRGKLDFRRTIRASLSAGGVPMHTVSRPRRPRRTDLVIICDVSESVSSFARFTLLLVYALREQFTRVRVFAFVDELDEVTDLLAPGTDVLDAIAQIDQLARVRGWYGRTDYGRAFGEFDGRFADAVTPRTALLILGDARSNYGDPGTAALSRIAQRARHAHWLNPERRTAWDTGDSCAAAVGTVVPMTECRTLAQLGEFVRALAP
jgi:uncharacterized protein